MGTRSRLAAPGHSGPDCGVGVMLDFNIPARHRVNFDCINDAALAVLPSLLKRWLPGGKLEGCEYVARNPRRADRHFGSFKVNLQTGLWADFATRDRGSDPVS